MSKTRMGLPATRLIMLAMLAGAVAGGVALYVSGGPSGNLTTAAVEPADRCEARSDDALRLQDFAGGEVAAMMRADPPQSVADLSFNAPDGSPKTIRDMEGRTLLVNLWATWCAPCRAEMPALDELQGERGGEAFEVVAVNVDTGGDEKPMAFLEEIGVDKLAYYRDPSLGLFNDLKRRGLALGLPVTLLVGEDGCLLAHMNGPAEWSSPDALRLVDAAVGGRD